MTDALKAQLIAKLHEFFPPWEFTGTEPACVDLFALIDAACLPEHQELILWKTEVRGLRRDFNELRNASTELMTALEDAERLMDLIGYVHRLRDVLRKMSVHDSIRDR